MLELDEWMIRNLGGMDKLVLCSFLLQGSAL